jgi:transketolase
MRKTAIDMIYELAKKDPRVVFVGSDLSPSTLKKMKDEMPERWFMEGISEANIVGLASGMALEGKIPYINTITTFLMRRACEQVVLDMCLHNVNVRLLGSGGGLVYAPLGPTHLAIEDMAIGRAIPNLTIVAPCDAEEMKRVMLQSVDWKGPMYIRFGKGGEPVVSSPDKEFKIGKPISMREGKDAVIFSIGVTLKTALDAAEELFKKGISAGVVHVHTLKPFDTAAIREAMATVKAVLTIEEHTILGGLGSAVAEVIAEAGFNPSKRFIRMGIPDVFPHEYGSQATQMKAFGLTSENIVTEITALLEGKATGQGGARAIERGA